MADEEEVKKGIRGIQEMGEEARKTAETLRKQNLDQEMSGLKSELATFKSDSSKVRSAMLEMTRSINLLKSPLASHAASIIESISSYKQATELQKRQTAVAEQNLKAAQSNLNAGKAEQTLLLERIKSAKEAREALIKSKEEYTKESMSLGALNDIKAKEVQLKQEEVKKLTEASGGQSNVYLSRAQSELAKLQDEYNQQFNELLERTERQTKEEDGHNSAIAELTKQIEENTELAKKQKETNKELVEAQKKAKEDLEKQKAEETATHFRKLSDVTSRVSVALEDFVKTVRDTQNRLGISSSNAVDVIMGNFGRSLQSFFTSLTTVSSQEILTQQEAFQEQFGGVLTSGAAKNLAIQAKELGVTGAQLASARRVFMTSTMGNLGQAQAQQEQFLATFRQQGLTNKDAMNAIAQYSELYARNGTRFADSFTRAAAEAKKIGVDLGKIDQVGDNIIGDFEGFLEKTAELGAMGFNLDTTRLGEAAESGDTGALMTELRSQLAATGKDLTNLRRSEQLALSNAFGIPMAELQRLAGPTAGSGEQLTEQEQTNSILTIIADKAGVLVGIMSALFGLISGAHTMLLGRIAINTSGGAISGLGGLTKSLFGFGGAAGTAGQSAAGGIAGTAGQSAAGALAGAAPVGGASEGATSGISKLSSSINPTSLIKGAAALVIMAGALFLMGKAMQQFKDVSAGDLGVAIGAITLLTLAMVGLGLVMGSVVGGAAILAGIATLVVMAGAVYLLGKALQSVGDSAEGIGTLGTSFDSLATAMARFNEVELSETNVDKIKELATPTLGQNIANAAKSVEALFTSAVAEGKTAETAAPAIDFTRLEAKLDQVVRAIGSMEVKMDATKVGEIVVSNERRVANTGIFSQPRNT